MQEKLRRPGDGRRFHRSRVLATGCAVLAALSIAACGSSHSSSGSSGGSSGGSASSGGSSASASSGGLKKGLKIYVVPKSLGNNYFTVADSAKSGGAIAAAQSLGESGVETSGSTATPAAQLPAIQAAISKGANALLVSATDPTALCPTLKQAMARGISVVTYDSDAPTCRNMFINQASSQAIGDSEVDLLAKQIHDSGEIGIVSDQASTPNQDTWIMYMRQELKKFPKMHIVSIVYGDDDPTTASQVTSGLLQHYPHLAGIIAPDTVAIAAAASVLDTPQYRGKVMLTGLGTPLSMKKYVDDGTVTSFELWDPAHLGYLAAYAAVLLQSKKITGKTGESFTAGSLGKYTIGPDDTVVLGPPLVFTKANIGQYHF